MDSELTHLMGTHEIPTHMWPRELSFKLLEKPRNWYVSQFAALSAGTFPPSMLLCSSLIASCIKPQELIGIRDLHCAMLVPGTTGTEALHRIDELVMLLQRTGVAKPGEEEQMSYILQNLLTAEEVPRWTALANGDMAVSDAGLNELALRTTNVTGRCHSCPPKTREAFLLAARNTCGTSSAIWALLVVAGMVGLFYSCGGPVCAGGLRRRGRRDGRGRL